MVEVVVDFIILCNLVQSLVSKPMLMAATRPRFYIIKHADGAEMINPDNSKLLLEYGYTSGWFCVWCVCHPL